MINLRGESNIKVKKITTTLSNFTENQIINHNMDVDEILHVEFLQVYPTQRVRRSDYWHSNSVGHSGINWVVPDANKRNQIQIHSYSGTAGTYEVIIVGK